jgi:signal transduction histidine kinase/ligand-binding sensor domain-containing protein
MQFNEFAASGRHKVRLRWRTRVIFAVSLAMSLPGVITRRAAAHAQVLQDYHHTAWTIENGLINSAVWAVQQAPNGFLWLTTPTGVFRFDGQRFESVDEVTNREVHNADIISVFLSSSGGVWLTTRTHGLLLWKDNRVTNYPDRRCVPAARNGGIVEDRHGPLWIAASSGLFRLRNGTCEQINNDPAFPGGVPLAILMDRAGTLWVKWPTGAFYFLKRGESTFKRCSSGEGVGGEYAFLRQAPDGSIWLSDAGGLRRVTGSSDPSKLIARPERIRKPPSDFGSFTFAPNGALWASSGQGVYHFKNVEQYKVGEPLSTAGAEAFTVNQGLSSSIAGDLLIDRESTIWIGTNSGLDQLRRNVLSTVAMPTTLEHPIAIAAGDDGSVWVGSRGQPLTHISKDGHVQVFAKTRQCIAIRREFDGSIWSSGLGDARLWRTMGGDPSPVAFPPGDIRSATDIAVDRNHELWITTFTPDSYHRAGTTWTKVTEALGRKPGIIGAMAGDSEGNIWFAFSNKLVEWDGSAYHRFSFPDGSLNISVAVVAVRDDHVWLGGGRGVVLFSHGRFQLMRWKDERNPGRISGLVETEARELWVNGTSGVIRVPAAELKKWLNDSEYAVSADRFDLEDGLPGLAEERWPEPSLVESSSGVLWFATNKGIAWIDPAKVGGTTNRIPPPVFVNNVVAKGEMYRGTIGPLALPAKGNLEFNYTALSLVIPKRVLFRYKLEGIDPDWQSAGTRRQAFYTNLPPGKYRFHVIACNNDGVWNEVGASVDFSIAPAWYQTWWFRTLGVAAFLALLWGLYQLRLRQLAGQFAIRLEERVNERTRIARDLHDTMLQTFQGVLLKFYGLSVMLADRPEAEQKLEGLLEQGQQAINEGREAVLRSSTVIANDLAGAFATLGEELAAKQDSHNPVAFQVEVEGETRDLHPILRDEVYRIACEALRNAFQHSGAARIEVRLHYDDRQFWVCIRDNGKGIDAKVVDACGREGHYGLPGMHERAKLAGGSLVVRSRVNSGTEVEIIIPAARAYAKSHSRRRARW